VRRTFDYLAKAQSGSRLVFTYVRRDFVEGTNSYGLGPGSQAVRIRDQLWHFGLEPGEAAPLLAEYGWRVVEQMGAQEADAWYPAPGGRTLATQGVEGTVHAEKS
jgi:O-methyltransferase involved in polyketide biosynthesis